jgi:hypothetical protein
MLNFGFDNILIFAFVLFFAKKKKNKYMGRWTETQMLYIAAVSVWNVCHLRFQPVIS